MAKILLIEDDKGTNEIYSHVLREAGFTVDSATDGYQGLAKAKSGGYDLILLDVMLPKVDGITLLSELKKNPPSNPNKKIIMLTNLSHDTVMKEAKNLGVFASITKSDIDPGQLLEEVKKQIA